MSRTAHPTQLHSYQIHYPSMSEYDYDTDSSQVSDLGSLVSFANGTNPSVISSQTSHDVSMRSHSPTPSVLSMTPSMQERAFRHEYGRGLNSRSEVYRLPADDEELERLDMQNHMLIDITGRYPPPFHDIMQDNVPGERKACLDIGCGAGAWILQVAREYPNCNAVAVDLIPMQSIDMPANCRSEVDDVNLGLEHFYNDFNVVHAHLICAGIKDYANLIEQISHVLRPGGLIDLLEYDYHIYGPDHQRISVNAESLEEGPWWPKWLAYAHRAIENAGGCPDAGQQFEGWINANPAYGKAVVEEHWVPATPHPAFDARHPSATMRADIMQFIKAGRPMLLKSGVEQSVVDRLETQALQELQLQRHPYLIRIRKVWAIKTQ